MIPIRKTISPRKAIKGVFKAPPDKSISQRGVIFGSLAKGVSRIKNLLLSDDVNSTIGCIRGLGIEVRDSGQGSFEITGRGLGGLREPAGVLDAGNSGTCLRILSGVLAGQGFYSVITGDESLRNRPMSRIVNPLGEMGAKIWGRNGGSLAPLSFNGGDLVGMEHHLLVASAQVKSCLMMAGLYARGNTLIHQLAPSRDHTEKMLEAMGANIRVAGLTVEIIPGSELKPLNIEVPGDPSSASYLAAGAMILPGSAVTIEDICLNPTRTGFFDAATRMGARIQRKNIRETPWGEPVGDLVVEYAPLSGIEITSDQVPRLIDELPLIGVVGAFSSGALKVSGAGELRVKETDRIKTLKENFRAIGGRITEMDDGFIIEGNQTLAGGMVDATGDHRMAMTFAIAALGAGGPVTIGGSEAASVSYPRFWDLPIFDHQTGERGE